MVVEDDNVLRDILSEKLEKSGYVVDRAEDGIIAMEKIRAARPDAILLDVLMPRKGGIEVMEDINNDPALKGIPIIIISNSGQPVEMKRAKDLGARDFLIKAVFNPNEVIEKVERVLAGENVTTGGQWGVHIQGVVVAGAVETPKEVVNVIEKAVASVTAPDAVVDKVFVLVIEDDKFLRELLVRKLTSEGFEVKNAIEAEAAFRILADSKPNIILCDIILPGMDGFEILGRIKSNPKTADIPVVILSNLGQKEDLDRAMALGATDFIVKANFTLDEIVAKVRSVLGSK